MDLGGIEFLRGDAGGGGIEAEKPGLQTGRDKALVESEGEVIVDRHQNGARLLEGDPRHHACCCSTCRRAVNVKLTRRGTTQLLPELETVRIVQQRRSARLIRDRKVAGSNPVAPTTSHRVF